MEVKKNIITLNRAPTYKDYLKEPDDRLSKVEIEIRDKAKNLAEEGMFKYFCSVGDSLELIKQLEKYPKDMDVFDYMVKIYFKHQRKASKYYDLNKLMPYQILQKKLYMISLMNKQTLGESNNMGGRVNVCAEYLYQRYPQSVIEYYAYQQLSKSLRSKGIQLTNMALEYIGCEKGMWGYYNIPNELRNHLNENGVEYTYPIFMHNLDYFFKKYNISNSLAIWNLGACSTEEERKAQEEYKNESTWRVNL